VTLGSGSNDLYGGGALLINASGTVTVDGLLQADGGRWWDNHQIDGTAGGSVSLVAGTLTGSGAITATGADGTAHGGGGGYVALRAAVNTFVGTVSVAGGAAPVPGQAGQVYGMIPPAPTGLTVTQERDGNQAYTDQVRLQWTNPVVSDLSAMVVRYSTTGVPTSVTDGIGLPVPAPTPGAVQTVIHNGVDYLVTYYYAVWAQNQVGGYSKTAATGSVWVQPPGPYFEVKVSDAKAVSGGSVTAVVTAKDSGGNVLVNYSGSPTVSTVYVNPTTGTSSVRVTAGSWVKGVRISTLSYADAGQVQVDVVDGGMVGRSEGVVFYPASFDVDLDTTPSPPVRTTRSKLFTVGTPLVAGKAFLLRVTAKDDSGSTVPNYRGTVRLSVGYVAPGSGTKGLSVVSIGPSGFIGGEGKVSVTYGDVGEVVIEGKDSTYVSGVTIEGTSGRLTFIPAALSVDVMGPAAGRGVWYIGEEIPVGVTVRALDGSVAPNYRGTVSFKAVSGLVVPMDYTFSGSEGGSYLFRGVKGSVAGSYLVEVVDAGTPAVKGMSGSISVVKAKVVVTAVKGPVGTLPVPIQVMDDKGNLVVDDSTVFTVVLTEERVDGSARADQGQVIFLKGQGTLLVTDTVGEEVTVSGSTVPGLPVQSGVVTFESAVSNSDPFRYVTFEKAGGGSGVVGGTG
jgi:hypothetical protein